MKKSQPQVPERRSVRYSAADKMKVVKLYLEDGHQLKQIAEQFQIGKSTLTTWVRDYQANGIEAFTGSPPVNQLAGSEDAVREIISAQILDHKAAHPSHGPLRITQVFRRLLGLPVTVHQVRQTLEAQETIPSSVRGKTKREPAPIRFFERNSPNELWHTDVMYFIMPNREKVFVIGYLDDYSRFITGMDLYHRQTVGNTLDLLKKSCGDHTFPKEILTDGGRQFVSWTGNNQFGTYLRNHDIKHTVCRPHHPQTNGKMERFWRTLRMEFFDKAKINLFDELREQLQLYVKYYNFQRPHQGIGGMTPADRFFEIETEVKKQMTERIAENTLELALKGALKKPFFMVGRVGDSNVAIMEQKGRLSMQIDGVTHPAGNPLTFDLTQAIDKQENKEYINHGNDNESGNDIPADENRRTGVECAREMQGNPGDLDGKDLDQRGMSGIFDATSSGGTLGDTGIGGDASGIGSASARTACGRDIAAGFIQPPGETSGTEVQSESENTASEGGIAPGKQVGASGEKSSAGASVEGENRYRINGDISDFSITI